MSTFTGTWKKGCFKVEEQIASVKELNDKNLIVIWDYEREFDNQEGFWEWMSTCYKAKDDKKLRPVRADIKINGQSYKGCVPKNINFGDMDHTEVQTIELKMRYDKKEDK